MSRLLELKDRVGRYLREVLSDVRINHDGSGYYVPFENYGLEIVFENIEDEEQIKWSEENGMPLTKVVFRAWVTTGITESPEFFKFFATELQQKITLQAFVGKDDSDDSKVAVGVYVRIPGDTLDPNELRFTLRSVIWDCDTIGEQLAERFGTAWIRQGEE